jgi:hypothetical protein
MPAACRLEAAALIWFDDPKLVRPIWSPEIRLTHYPECRKQMSLSACLRPKWAEFVAPRIGFRPAERAGDGEPVLTCSERLVLPD